LEVLKDNSPASEGGRGEVVGTNLHSYAMPLIRYQLGDIVTKGSEICACGQPFSTIRAVQGRMIDYFPLPGGREIHPYEIVVLLRDSASWLRQYQLVQEQKDRIVLRVVTWTGPSAEDIASLSNSVSNRLRPGVEFQVQLVPDLQFEPNEKFRVSRSLVCSVYDGIEWKGKKVQ
jgi:phenylacetate-CoA ligase